MSFYNEPAYVLEALYTHPPLLEKSIRTGLINEMDILFMDDPSLCTDFTKVKQLYERYGSAYILDVLTRPDISDTQFPVFYDRQTQKYNPPRVVGPEVLGFDPMAIGEANFAMEVKDLIDHVRRDKLKEATFAVYTKLCDDIGADVSKLMERRDKIMSKLETRASVRSWSDVVAENEAYGEKPKIFTGIEAIDEKVLMREGNILTIGATPGGGKTSMINQMVVNWMLPEKNIHDYSCLYFSLENDGRETQKFMSEYMGSLPDYHGQYTKIRETMRKFRLSYCSDLFDINEIVAEIHKKIAADPRLKYIVIDFVQLCRDKTVSDGNEYKVCTRVMEHLKELKNKNLFIVILSQFDKASAKEKEAPTMYSLKGAGGISEMSSYILVNMRPKIEGNPPNGLIPVVCYVLKARHSPQCQIQLMFSGRQKRFYSVNEDGTIYRQEDSSSD